MASFKVFTQGSEVNGETILSIVDGLGQVKSRALNILSGCGINNPAPGKWYPQQSWLDAFLVISEETGPFTLFNIGKKIPENAQFPPDINDIYKALAAVDVAYHMNHRIQNEILFNPQTGHMKEGIGHYGFERKSENHIIMKCDNPYPCDFDRGIIEAMAQRFKPSSVFFVKINHDNNAPCRKKGADSCTYHITW